jgi:hypothetical protein
LIYSEFSSLYFLLYSLLFSTHSSSCRYFSRFFLELIDLPKHTFLAKKEGSGIIKGVYKYNGETFYISKQFICYTSFFKDNYLTHLFPEFDSNNIKNNQIVKSTFDTLMDMLDILYAYNYDLKVIANFSNGKSKFLSLMSQNIGFERFDFSQVNTAYELSETESFRELITNMTDLLSIRGTKLAYEIFFRALGYFIELQPFNSIHFEYDFEHLSPALFSEQAGIVWNKCFKSALAKAQQLKNDNITYYIDWVVPQFSNYGNGIYQSRYIGSAGYGWESMEPGNSITSTKLYSDYHDYYTNGTIPYSQTGPYYAWFKGAIENYKYHYVTNYQLRMKSEFQVYSIVHNTDITKKMLEEILGPNHDRLACGYFWYYQEPIEGADFAFQRKEVNINGSLKFGDRNRLEVCPSLMYAMAVWCMCYADGLFMWYQSTIGEEVAAARLDRENSSLDDDTVDAKWGNTTWVGKSSLDWAYVGYLHAKQNEDIISATTEWLVPDLSLGGGSWTTGTANYPVSLYNSSRPICRYKLSQDGTEALVLIYNGFNNGYTKDTFTLRLPAKSNYEFTADVWGNYTSVIRIKNL